MPLDTSIPMSYRPNVALDVEGARQNAMNAQFAQQQNMMNKAKLAAQQADEADLRGVNALAANPGFNVNDPLTAQQLGSTPQGRDFLAKTYANTSAKFGAQKADQEVIDSELAARLAALKAIGPKNPNLSRLLTSWRQGTRSNPHLQAWMDSQGIVQPDDETYAQSVSTPQGALEQYNGSLRSLTHLTGGGKQKLTETTTNKGTEFIDTGEGSDTYGQTLITRGAAPKGGPSTVINMGDRAFGKTLGEGFGKQFNDLAETANAAVESYQNTDNLYKFVNDPTFIAGAMGDWKAMAAKQLGLKGVNETDAYFARVGKEVGQEIKAFGAGTGISDSDRKYAQEIAGGSRTMNPEAIRLIMYARQMVNRAKIRKYNARRLFLAENNPDANIAGLSEEIPVPPPPAFNGKGWSLHQDKDGNYAYVSPAGKNGKASIEEVE